MPQPNASQDFLAALNVIKANPEMLAAFTADQAILKSLDTTTSVRVTETEPDHWTEGSDGRTPGKEVLKIGPSQSANGNGAVKMVREYSDLAGQMGITQEVEKLSRMLTPMASSMKSLTDVVAKQSASLDVLAQATMSLVKSATVAKAEEEEEEEETIEVGKALVTKASSMFAKALAKAEEAEEEEEEETAKAASAEASRLKSGATKLIRKAAAMIPEIGDTTFAKSVQKVARKAGVTIKAEDDEEEEEEEMGKSEVQRLTAAAAKAKDPAIKAALEAALTAAKAEPARNQAARKDPETGNQDDAAMKARLEGLVGDIQKAASGIGMLQMSVGQMVDHIGTMSKTGRPMPQLVAGAGAGGVVSKAALMSAALEQIEIAEESAMIEPGAAAEGREIVRYLRLVDEGKVDINIVKARIEKAPSQLQAIIGGLAA